MTKLLNHLANLCRQYWKMIALIGTVALLAAVALGSHIAWRNHQQAQAAAMTQQKAAQTAKEAAAKAEAEQKRKADAAAYQATHQYALPAGGTLWWTSADACHDPLRWTEIRFADGSTISNPERIRAGKMILLPSDCPISANFAPRLLTWTSPVTTTSAADLPPTNVPAPQEPKLTAAPQTTAMTEPTPAFATPNLQPNPPPPAPTTAQPSGEEQAPAQEMIQPQSPASVPTHASKGWYRVTIPNSKLPQAIASGTFPAVFLDKPTSNGTWKYRKDIGVEVVQNDNDTVTLTTRLPKSLMADSALAFYSSEGKFYFTGTSLLKYGERIPSPSFNKFNFHDDPDAAAQKRALHAIFAKQPAGTLRKVVTYGSLAAQNVAAVFMPPLWIAVGPQDGYFLTQKVEEHILAKAQREQALAMFQQQRTNQPAAGRPTTR